MEERLVVEVQRYPHIYNVNLYNNKKAPPALVAMNCSATRKPGSEAKQVHGCVEATVWSLRCVNVQPKTKLRSV